MVKNPPANAEDIRDSGSIPGGGPGNPLQCSCLKNPMDTGDWQATVQRVAKSQTRLKRLCMHTHFFSFFFTHYFLRAHDVSGVVASLSLPLPITLLHR